MIRAPSDQRGVSLLQMLMVLGLAAMMTAIMVGGLSSLERTTDAQDVIRTTAALLEAGQSVRTSGNYTFVRQRAGIPPERFSGTAGVVVGETVVTFATDRLGTNGSVGVWIDIADASVCLDLARPAVQRFGRVFLGATEIGGLSGLASRGTVAGSNPLLIGDGVLFDLCQNTVPRRLRVYEH